jgi:hypothetical protein
MFENIALKGHTRIKSKRLTQAKNLEEIREQVLTQYCGWETLYEEAT